MSDSIASKVRLLNSHWLKYEVLFLKSVSQLPDPLFSSLDAMLFRVSVTSTQAAMNSSRNLWRLC